VVRVGNDKRAIITAQQYEHQLEAVFLKAMDMICGHKGSDPQVIVDTVYDVRSLPSPSPEV